MSETTNIIMDTTASEATNMIMDTTTRIIETTTSEATVTSTIGTTIISETSLSDRARSSSNRLVGLRCNRRLVLEYRCAQSLRTNLEEG